jgi:hypothetical protein
MFNSVYIPAAICSYTKELTRMELICQLFFKVNEAAVQYNIKNAT